MALMNKKRVRIDNRDKQHGWKTLLKSNIVNEEPSGKKTKTKKFSIDLKVLLSSFLFALVGVVGLQFIPAAWTAIWLVFLFIVHLILQHKGF